MQITFGDFYLAVSDLAHGRVGPVDLSINGQAVVDTVPLFGGASAGVWARGNRSQVVSFAVQHVFSSAAAALHFAGMIHEELADQADLILTEGARTVAMEDACLQEVRRESWRGCALTLRYTFHGRAWTGDGIEPLPAPGEPLSMIPEYASSAALLAADLAIGALAKIADVPYLFYCADTPGTAAASWQQFSTAPATVLGGTAANRTTRLARAANQTATSGAACYIQFDTEVADPLGIWVVGAPTRLTVPAAGAGLWRFTAHFYANEAITGQVQFGARLNGVIFVFTNNRYMSGATYQDVLGFELALVEGDYLEFFFYQASGADRTVQMQTFSAYRIEPAPAP